MKNQKGGTAPGLDGIPIMVYKKFALSFVPIMVLIFNAILSTCKWPEASKTSVILPLFKKRKAEEHSNYRPISLIPTMSKVIEKIIDVRLSKWPEVYKRIKKEQGGFRAGYNTADRMFVLHAFSEKYGRGENEFYVALDLQKAFDSVDRELLIMELIKIGLPGHFAQLVANMYGSTKAVEYKSRKECLEKEIQGYLNRQDVLNKEVPFHLGYSDYSCTTL